MPAIGLSEEQAQLIDIAASFCRDKSPVDAVRALLEEDTGFNPDIWQEIAELGWLGIGIPDTYGGIGLGLGEIVPIVEQMGRHLLTTPYVSTVLAAQAVLRGGTEAQKNEILPKLATGTAATLGFCEDHGDWNLAHVTCKGSVAGDKLTLFGTKYLVSDVHQAAFMIATVAVNDQANLVIIPTDALPPEAIRREKIIDETRRAFAVVLDGISLPADALMDARAAADTLAHIELAASLLAAAEMCGGTYSVVDYTLDYLKTRKQFGKLIGGYQSLKHTMVDAHMGYERARAHLYSAAFLFGQQGEGEVAVRMAKAEAEEAFAFAADRAIQFHGGYGFTYDCDAQLYRRRAIWNAALYGDARYHRRKLADLMF
jgi:alkylation response protein AidB-like acyl-CoA dehydrogenase